MSLREINQSETDSRLTVPSACRVHTGTCTEVMPERAMTKLLYDIEDYLEDAAKTPHMPGWMRRIVRSVGRTVGEADAPATEGSSPQG